MTSTFHLYGGTNQHLCSVAGTFTGMRFGYDSLSSIPTLVKYSCHPATGGPWRGTWPCWTPPTGSSSSSSLNPQPQSRPWGFDKEMNSAVMFTLAVGLYPAPPPLRPPGRTDYTPLRSPPALPAGILSPPRAAWPAAAAAAGTCGR